MSTAYKVLRLPYVPTAVVPEYVPTNYTPASATMDGHLEGIDDALVGGGGGGVSLSNAIPAALGTAAAGTGTAASRDDHVHAMPSAAAVGADPAGTASAAVAAHVAAADPHPGYVLESREAQAGGIATLDGSGQVPLSQLGNVVSGLAYQGTWNAATNTPTLTDGSGSTGHYYIVSVAGSTSLDGVSEWAVGDWVMHNDSLGVWQKVDTSDAVSSVAGKTGVVALDANDVSETATKLWLSDTERTKLSGIEALADVTDATNVDAAGAVMEADYNAHTILAATSDDTPVALTVGEQTLVGRITGGNIAALTAAQARVLIAQADALPFEAVGVHPDATVPATLTAPYDLTVASAYVVAIGDVPSVGTATLTVTNVTQTRTIVSSIDLVTLSPAVDVPEDLAGTLGSGTAIQADAGDVLRATLVYSSGVLPAEVSGVAQAEISIILYVVPR